MTGKCANENMIWVQRNFFYLWYQTSVTK